MVDPDRRGVLLVCGSTRAGSSNLTALHAAHMLRLDGLATDLYDGLIGLPAFVPGQDPAPAPVSDLYDRIEQADAVLFSTPEYAGGLPGSLKNLLDWVVGGGQLYGKSVGWLDVANPGRGGGARGQLASVLHYVGARIVRDACVRVQLERTPEGLVFPESGFPLLRRSLIELVAGGESDSPAVLADGLIIDTFNGDRADLRDLFELAEDSATELDSYLYSGQVLVARSAGEVIGYVQLVAPGMPGEVELKSMAVRPAEQGRGVGRRLVFAAVEQSEANSARRIVVATAAADTGNLRFYQRQGFRLRSVDRDIFTPDRGYPEQIDIEGIPLRDRVWLDRPITPADAVGNA